MPTFACPWRAFWQEEDLIGSSDVRRAARSPPALARKLQRLRSVAKVGSLFRAHYSARLPYILYSSPFSSSQHPFCLFQLLTFQSPLLVSIGSSHPHRIDQFQSKGLEKVGVGEGFFLGRSGIQSPSSLARVELEPQRKGRLAGGFAWHLPLLLVCLFCFFSFPMGVLKKKQEALQHRAVHTAERLGMGLGCWGAQSASRALGSGQHLDLFMT